MKPEDCNGCKSKSDDCTYHRIMYSGRKLQEPCPCVMCLVKGICEDPCEEYEVFADRAALGGLEL